MAAVQNARLNGINGHGPASRFARFSDIPSNIDIPVSEGDADEVVELDLAELPDDPSELCQLLENESAAKSFWIRLALAYAKQDKMDTAIEIINQGLEVQEHENRLELLTALCWMYLWKCRGAARVRQDGELASEARVKDYYIQQATQTVNDAARVSGTYPPLFLARGVLYLLKASLQQPSNVTAGATDNSERAMLFRQASKCFDDSLKASRGKNMLAVLGKGRIHFSMGKYGDALQCFQEVLKKAPQVTDPDPRIGIGCCYWQLGHRDEARGAWERALQVNPESKIANILLSIYHLQATSRYNMADPQFAENYKKAMTVYAQKAFKLDRHHPLTCATFAGYFLMRKSVDHAESLSRRAIELSDQNAIVSDGWYLLARKEHLDGNIAKANEYYIKSDIARGGDERGYLPAKFGSVQMKVLMGDTDDAKFKLEKIVEQSKSIEAMTLLGTLHCEDVFAANPAEDKSKEFKKAVTLLEAVRTSWKDPKQKITPDSAVLLALARLYERDSPKKSLECLQQVEEMEIKAIPEDERPELEDESEQQAALREFLPPQLLSNIGSFHFHFEKFSLAREYFQSALDACAKLRERDESMDTTHLTISISYNLGRTFEAEGNMDEARAIFQKITDQHPDYLDARIRLSYINLRQDPSGDGPKSLQKLFQTHPSNMEVRAMFGWYLNKSKRKTIDARADQEQRHLKDTLSNFDSHDPYALVEIANVFMTIAREMPRSTDQEKARRKESFASAVKFFDKALSHDPRNAYAAQGLAIIMAEERKEYNQALQLFTKLKDTIKDSSVHINLGHAYTEVKQYGRAVENYEAALFKDKQQDPQVRACLGKVWLYRGITEKSLAAMNTALEYSRQAYELAPQHSHFKFNIAFVQTQIATEIQKIPESERTLEQVEAAARDLDEAMESFLQIAKSPNPPFPPKQIEQRAGYGNSVKKALERVIQSQREYEERNEARLKHAREVREAEIARREEEKRKAAEVAEERRRKIAEERQRMQERDMELAQQRAEEEKAREEAEMTTDPETGERVKREKRKKGVGKRKKKDLVADSDLENDVVSDDDAIEKPKKSRRRREDEDEERPRTKKRRLERKGGKSSKYKSAEIIEDSDEDDEPAPAADTPAGSDDEANGDVAPRRKGKVIDDEDEDDELPDAPDDDE